MKISINKRIMSKTTLGIYKKRSYSKVNNTYIIYVVSDYSRGYYNRFYIKYNNENSNK